MKTKLIVTLAAATAISAQASLFYLNDFSAPVGTEWSDITRSTSPVGARQFLGEFSAGTVTLSLTGLPAHSQASVSFDLFVLKSWDGSDGSYGPDRFLFAAGDAGAQTTMLDTTFSNVFPQAYPDPFSSGLTHPERTGAAESNTLGYPDYGDTVYHLEFPLSHTASTFTAVFQAIGLQGIVDESWGLDNVQLNITPVPEPGHYAAVAGLALVAFGAWRRCRR